jgi:hypothetical protein
MASERLSKKRTTGPADFTRVRLTFLSQLDTEALIEFRRSVSSATTERLNALWKEKKNDAKTIPAHGIAAQILSSYYEDAIAVLESVTRLASTLSIVALFGEVERRYKAMCGVAIPGVDAQQLFRWDDFKKVLRKAGIRLSEVADYKTVNELRCLNNAIKHSGKVDKKLADAGWGKLGGAIDEDECDREFDTFVSGSVQFLADLRLRLSRVVSAA